MPPLPGTPPPLFQILAVVREDECTVLVHESVVSRYESYVCTSSRVVRESERVLARTKKGVARLKASWYTRLKLILFMNTPGTFCAREQKGL